MTSCVKNKIAYVDYYPNGSPKVKGYKCQNKLCDSIIGYYDNGEILFTGYYKNSVQEGQWRYYHRNKKKQSIQEFRNGKLISINFWDKKGNLTIKDGTGKAVIFYENGNIMGEQNWNNNKLHGLSISYDTLGKVIDSTIFYYGEIQNK